MKKTNKTNTWLFIIVIAVIIGGLTYTSGLLPSNDITVNNLPPMTIEEYESISEGRATSLSRGYAVNGYICTLESTNNWEFTATSYSDERACYTNDEHLGATIVLNEITSGSWSTVGSKDVVQGSTACFDVTPGKTYVMDLYPCNGVPESTVCSDSDNRDYELKGTLQVNGGTVYEDYCIDDTTLLERYCSDYAANLNEEIDCEQEYGVGSVCYEGRCFAPDDSYVTIQCATCEGNQRVVNDLAITLGDSVNCLDYQGYFPEEASFSCEASIVETATGPGTGFQPEVVNMYVESTPGNSDWVLVPEGGEIPTSITGKWESTEYVDVLVEIDNSAAANWNTQSNAFDTYEAATPEQKADLNAFFGKMFQLRTLDSEPGIGYVWDLEKQTDATMYNTQNIQLLNSFEYINFALLEVSFLSEENTQAYGFPRYATLKGIEPVSIRDSCLGAEAQEGWIESYALLMTSPIDGECWNYATKPSRIEYSKANYNGYCNFIVKATVKVPAVGDRLASGHSNYNAEGKYYLQSSVYEECSSPVFGGPDWLSTYEAKARTTPGSVGSACCRTGWFIDYDYFFTTDVACQSLGGTIMTDSSSLARCQSSQSEMDEYYKCDEVNNEVSFENFNPEDSSWNRQLWKVVPNDDRSLAYLACGVDEPSGETRVCYACNDEQIEVSVDDSCPKYPATTTDYYELEEIENGICGQGSRAVCYACEGAEYVSLSAPFTNDEETSCRAVGAFTSDYKTSNPLYCAQKLEEDTRTPVFIINPDNDEEWCVTSGGSSECYPRKESIKRVSLTDSSVQDIGWLNIGDDFVNALLYEEENSLCLKDATIMCGEGSVCLSAQKNSLNEDKALVYDVLKNKLSIWGTASELLGGWTPFGQVYSLVSGQVSFDEFWLIDYFTDRNINTLSSRERFVEEFGVCVEGTGDQGLLSDLRYKIADILGLDPEGPGVVIAMVVIGGLAIYIVYQVVKPVNPRRPKSNTFPPLKRTTPNRSKRLVSFKRTKKR